MKQQQLEATLLNCRNLMRELLDHSAHPVATSVRADLEDMIETIEHLGIGSRPLTLADHQPRTTAEMEALRAEWGWIAKPPK